jgi:hypothetical protein
MTINAEEILRAATEDVYKSLVATVYSYTPTSERRRIDAAIGLLWDARKYLGCYPQDAGRVAVPGLYSKQLMAEEG